MSCGDIDPSVSRNCPVGVELYRGWKSELVVAFVYIIVLYFILFVNISLPPPFICGLISLVNLCGLEMIFGNRNMFERDRLLEHINSTWDVGRFLKNGGNLFTWGKIQRRPWCGSMTLAWCLITWVVQSGCRSVAFGAISGAGRIWLGSVHSAYLGDHLLKQIS